MGSSVRNILNFKKDTDIFYLSLPLYHNNAGTIGTAQALLFGNSIALREKFSASQFWTDCDKFKCTVSNVANM
jgi:solute carrier family 27 fatty acid transporter 1/4